MEVNLVGLVKMLTRYQKMVGVIDDFIRSEGDTCEWLADEYSKLGGAIEAFEVEIRRIGRVVEMTKISP